MAALLADWGVVPEAVLGHSLGEYAAAIVAGAAEPDPVLTLVAARGRMMQALPAGGAMAAVMTGRDHVAPVLARHRSEEHTSELQSLMRISYAVFCLKNK